MTVVATLFAEAGRHFGNEYGRSMQGSGEDREYWFGNEETFLHLVRPAMLDTGTGRRYLSETERPGECSGAQNRIHQPSSKLSC